MLGRKKNKKYSIKKKASRVATLLIYFINKQANGVATQPAYGGTIKKGEAIKNKRL
jgi:hypothetical protein